MFPLFRSCPFSSWLQIVCVYGYVSSFAIGLGPIPFLIISEIFPTRAVGAGAVSLICCLLCCLSLTRPPTAASFSIMFSWACNYAIAQLFPIMNESLGNYAFLPFVGTLTLSFFFTIKFVPETKGREVSELVASLRSE